MNVNRENTRAVTDKGLHQFIEFCRARLGYLHKATILISDNHEKAKEMKSMAAYYPDPEDNYIWVLRGKRVRADWYRSLAHELVHHSQREKGQVLDGTTGSDCENEANSRAGEFLRDWGKEHPEIYEEPAQTNQPT